MDYLGIGNKTRNSHLFLGLTGISQLEKWPACFACDSPLVSERISLCFRQTKLKSFKWIIKQNSFSKIHMSLSRVSPCCFVS